MRILVTGAGGYVGRHLVDALRRAGHEVIAAHRHPRDEPGTVMWDLRRPGGPATKADVVVHAAATSPGPGVKVADYALDNVGGTNVVRDHLAALGASRLILLSGISVYGTVSVPVVDEATPVVDPDAYGVSKRLCELMVAEASIPSLVLRLPGIIGPAARLPWPGRVGQALREGRPVRISTPDAPFNNALHVADLAGLINQALTVGWSGAEMLTLASAGGMSVRSAVETLARGLGVDARFEESDGGRAPFTISIERARRLFGYAPMEIGAMLSRYADEYDQERLCA